MTRGKTTQTAGAHRGGPTDPSHDEDLRRGILRTAVTRRTAWALVLPFLLLVFAIPIGQIIRDRRAGDESVLLDLFRHAPTRENIASSRTSWTRHRPRARSCGRGFKLS